MIREPNNKSDLSILIAGAVGDITAALLKRAGLNVEILCSREDYAKLISEKNFDDVIFDRLK